MNYIIVGAGLTGSVFAERLARNGNNKILIMDRKKHIGGTCYDFYDEAGILVHKYGPHIFNTASKTIWDYVNSFSPFLEYFHRVLGYVDGKLVPIPFNLESIERSFPSDLAGRMISKLLEKYGYNTKVPILEIQKQKDPDLQMIADYVYEKVFYHYTLKQWGMKPDEVGGKAMARIPVFISRDDRYFQNAYQGIPSYGYSYMIEKMLCAPNISIGLGMDYKNHIRLEPKTKRILFNGAPFEGQVIFTACLDGLFDYEYGKLPYRSLRFEFETLDKADFQPVATVNYPCNYSFTRITEFKKLTMQEHKKTTIMREYSTAYDPDHPEIDPLYPIPKQDNEEQYLKYRNKAYQYPQLIIAGRLADYRYFTMAETIENALSKVNKIG